MGAGGMFGRWLKGFCLVMAALVLVASPSAAAPPKPLLHRIVAIGDLHGDFAAWRDIARAAGVIDEKGRWRGGKTVLVQDGDVVDRGPDSLKIIQDLMRLQGEAKRAGGQVIAIVGNHEAMNMTDDLRYVSAGDYAAFTDRNSEALRQRVYAANIKAVEAAYRQRDPAMTSEAIKAAWMAATPLGKLEHQVAWHPNGKIGRWVMGNPAVVMLDGNLFLHGGLSTAYASMPLAEINKRVAAALAAGDEEPTSIINDPMGPLWYRGLVMREPVAKASDDAPAASPAAPPAPAPPTMEEELDQVLKACGAQRMIIAHTPILSGIAILYGGRLVRIDTGISAAIGGKLTYLEILDGALIPHVVERSAPLAAGAH
jgi:hypothetical protein